MSFIDLHTNVSLGHTKIVGLGGEKLWLCPTLGGDKLDISGNGNHGTYYGGMGTVALIGSGGTRAYDFDGINDRIDCPADTLGGSSTISMSCWVYQDSHDSTYGQGFMGQADFGGSTTNRVANLWSPASGSGKAVRSIIFTNTSGSYAEAYWGSPPPPLNAWNHWCMTADGSTIRLFKDGVLVDSTAYSGSPPTSPTVPLEIGRYRGGGGYNNFCLDGKMDDIRVFHRALTQEEVKHLASKRGVLGTPRNPVIKKRRIFYAPTAPPTTTAKAVVLKKPKPSYATGYARNASESANPNLWKGLVGAWMPSFGVTGNTLKDVSGNGNDGVLEHDTSWKTNDSQQSLYFDGVQDHVSGLGDISVSANKPFTITARVKLFSFADPFPFVFQIKTDTQYAYSMFVSNTSGYLGVNFGSANTWVRRNSNVSFDLNKTQTISLTYNGNGAGLSPNFSLYLNGKSITNSPASPFAALSQNNYIGTANAGSRGIDDWNGYISNFRIYNRALSPSEIKQLYLNPAAPFLRKQQTVGLSTAQAFNPYWANQATQLAGTLQ